MPSNLRLKKESKLFHTFCLLPDISFNSQEKDEKIILVLRAHPITQVSWILNLFLLLFLVVIFNIYLGSFLQKFFSNMQILAINIFLLAIIFSYAVVNITTWFFNVGIVTNKRILDLDYRPLTLRNFTGTQLDNVEDLSAVSVGPFSNIFNYGDVNIQTAGSEQNVEFLKVPFPDEVVKIINTLSNT